MKRQEKEKMKIVLKQQAWLDFTTLNRFTNCILFVQSCFLSIKI